MTNTNFKRSNRYGLTVRAPLRGQRGIQSLEVVLSSFLMITIAALTVNTCMFVFGFMALDSACRDACRAAAQQANSTDAQTAAQRQLNVHVVGGQWISQPTLSTSTFTYNDYGGNPPPNVSPYVTTTCSLTVTPPVNAVFFGINFADFLPKGGQQFSRTYTFPIVKTKFYQPS